MLETIATPDWTGKRILVVEDMDDNYLVIEALLKRTNIEVVRVKDGQDAVDAVNATPDFVAILMDISLPTMDGPEATRLILKDHPNIPIIAETAHAMEIHHTNMLAAGCVDYLRKPLRRNMLFESLCQFIPSNAV